MLQQQWPWLTPSGHPPAMSAASHLLISYTLLLYLTSKIVTPCWCTLVVSFFLSVLKEKRNVWNFVEIQRCPFFFFFCPSNTDLAIVFFLTRENKLVIIYCHDVNNDYDHLFTRCTRCPPACLCVHERSDDSMTEWRRMWRWRWWRRYRECLCYCYNVECFFLSCPREIHEKCFVCVCLSECECVCACFWTLICSSQGSELMLIWQLAFERKGVCVCGVCVWMCTCLRAWPSGYCDS